MIYACEIMVLVHIHLLLLQRYTGNLFSSPYQVLQRLLKLQEVQSVGVVAVKENENHAVLLVYLVSLRLFRSNISEVLLIIHKQHFSSFRVFNHTSSFFSA